MCVCAAGVSTQRGVPGVRSALFSGAGTLYPMLRPSLVLAENLGGPYPVVQWRKKPPGIPSRPCLPLPTSICGASRKFWKLPALMARQAPSEERACPLRQLQKTIEFVSARSSFDEGQRPSHGPGAITSRIVAVRTRPNRQNRSTRSCMSVPSVQKRKVRTVNQ